MAAKKISKTVKAAKRANKAVSRAAAIAKPPTQSEVAKARKASINSIIDQAAKKYGPGHVERADQMNTSYLLRRPTGIISLDIAMAGGWPAAAPSVVVGPDGAGKDYLLWRTAAESQRLYGSDFCMAVYFTEFKPDKLYMKDMCGFQVAFSEEEIEELDMARQKNGRVALSAQEIDHYRHQIGEFMPIFGLSADAGFDAIFAFIEANYCQLVAVNSIGSLQTEAKEATDSFEEHAQRSSEASLISRVMPKFSMYMNDRGPDGRPNETSVILVNQVRSVDAGAAKPKPGHAVQAKDTYKTASNAWALKHNKAIELFLHNGQKIWDLEAKPPYALGRKKQWEITKGKLGTHEGIKGEFDYFFGYGVDVHGDLIRTAVALGVIEQNGSWLKLDEGGFKFNLQGEPRVTALLNDNPGLIAHLRLRCFAEAGTICRHI